MLRKLLLFVIAVTPGLWASAETGAELRALTGAATRVVWVQNVEPSSPDPFAWGDRLRLMGFDSDDGRGERAIIERLGSVYRPLLAPDGERVVFSDNKRQRVFSVGFDGRGLTELGRGVALDVWREPQAQGRQWVYLAREVTDTKESRGRDVVRCQLDAPSRCEPVWNKTEITFDNFQISQDGSHAGGLFPWPQAGIADLRSGRLHPIETGCWTSLAPDDSYTLWTFADSHRELELASKDGRRRWSVPINKAPGIDGYEVYHPRWSNQPRVLAMTGPYTGASRKGIRIFAGGSNVEVYVGRFDSRLQGVERWLQVTENRAGDFFPDVWVKDAASHVEGRPRPEGDEPRPTGAWQRRGTERPDAGSGLPESTVFASRPGDGLAGRADKARFETRGGARVLSGGELELSDGAIVARGVADKLLEAARRDNELTLEAVITPARRIQEGPARIVSFSSSQTERDFTLGQQGPNLVFRLRTPRTGKNGVKPEVTLGMLRAGVPQHVIVSYRPGRLVYYLDGRKVLETDDIQGDFRNWEPQELIFGDELDGERHWEGRIEDVVISTRFIDEEEARRRYARSANPTPEREEEERSSPWLYRQRRSQGL